MRSWLALIVVIVLGAGCWSERAPAATTPPTTPTPSMATLDPAPAHRWPGSGAHHRRRVEDRCTQVVGHMFDLARQDGMSSGLVPAIFDDFQASAIESCHETGWSAESLGCYADTTSTSQMRECYESMTTEQREDLERRFMQLRSKHRPPPSPSP